MSNKDKDINIKNQTYYFFNGIINIESFDPNNIKTDENSYKDILIYYIGYAAIKEYLTIYSDKSFVPQIYKNEIKEIYKDFSLKIVFRPFKVGDLFSAKDAIPKLLRSFVVYKFVCPGCNVCYIGETTRHLSTRIEEHLEKDKKSHIFKHHCKILSTPDCFQIIDSASSKFRLKLKEEMHITWTKPSLNRQLKHVSISITV